MRPRYVSSVAQRSNLRIPRAFRAGRRCRIGRPTGVPKPPDRVAPAGWKAAMQQIGTLRYSTATRR